MFSALPWEMLGARPAMITLTYPGDWRLYVPDARELVRHRENFKERWRKMWGALIGVWVIEFQKRRAPHLHIYAALPDAVSDEDYRALQSRTARRRRSEYDLGPYEARRRMPAVPGDFGEWSRTAWWEVVGSGLPAHQKRGVDVAVAFFSDRAEGAADRAKVADYFWRESGKWAQKKPPEGFGSLRFYGRWGQRVGFNPVVEKSALDFRVGVELRRLLRRLRFAKARELALKTGRPIRRKAGRSRGLDGLTVFDVNATEVSPRLRACAEQLALDKVVVDRDRNATGRARRALPELEAADQPDVAHDRTDNEPDDHAEWDPVWEAERHAEHQAELEAAIEDAVEAESQRRWYINLIRTERGLPPITGPLRIRVGQAKPAGRERKAR
ncbi:MAG TPA: hypothetical protein VGO03_19770 [Acidimicrobiia bacterium]